MTHQRLPPWGIGNFPSSQLPQFPKGFSQGVSDGSWHPDPQNSLRNPHLKKKKIKKGCVSTLRCLKCSRIPRNPQLKGMGSSPFLSSCILHPNFTSASRLWQDPGGDNSISKSKTIHGTWERHIKVFSLFKLLKKIGFSTKMEDRKWG